MNDPQKPTSYWNQRVRIVPAMIVTVAATLFLILLFL